MRETKVIAKCYCERIKDDGCQVKGNLKALCIGTNYGNYASASLYMDYNINNNKYSLFAEATGDGGAGYYVGISYCPFCGKDLRSNKGEKNKDASN